MKLSFDFMLFARSNLSSRMVSSTSFHQYKWLCWQTLVWKHIRYCMCNWLFGLSGTVALLPSHILWPEFVHSDYLEVNDPWWCRNKNFGQNAIQMTFSVRKKFKAILQRKVDAFMHVVQRKKPSVIACRHSYAAYVMRTLITYRSAWFGGKLL
jgi:hypothetical protein